MKFFNTRKRIIAAAAVAALAVGVTGGAYAYFTTTGTGHGDATVGSASELTINQDSIVYSNVLTDNVLLPGTSATVTFTVDNPSSGNQQLGTISVASVTSDKAGCDSATHPTWFTSNTDVVNHDYAPGAGQAVAGNITINFVDAAEAQNVCQGATLTFHYAA